HRWGSVLCSDRLLSNRRSSIVVAFHPPRRRGAITFLRGKKPFLAVVSLGGRALCAKAVRMSHSMVEQLVVRGAREHNLKDVSLDLPRNSMIVFTGLPGSGKSSLAFDTSLDKGRRRYVASLSAYARQFLGQMDKPDVDFIEGLSPAISIDQKPTSQNPRSTVGTVTEIYDYLRLLYARIGRPTCPKHGVEITSQ